MCFAKISNPRSTGSGRAVPLILICFSKIYIQIHRHPSARHCIGLLASRLASWDGTAAGIAGHTAELPGVIYAKDLCHKLAAAKQQRKEALHGLRSGARSRHVSRRLRKVY